MNASDFRCPEAGKIVRTLDGYLAFVPAPLPPRVTYDNALVLALSRADAALSELSGLGRHLPNPRLLIGPYLRREAVLSSRIEGTRTNLSDLLLNEVGDEAAQHLSADMQEVRNYVVALEHGIQRLQDLPLSLRLVCELHERLMAGVRGESKMPGELRRDQNWIGPAGSVPETAVYVPPPPQEMMVALDDWERFLHQRDVLPDLIQCAVMHEQFEAIHPFRDGNGRLGRLLITLFLIERDRLSQPLLYLSAFLEAHRQDYYDLLQRVRTDGDWSGWLLLFLTGVTETAQAAVRQAGQLMDLREEYRARLRDRGRVVGLIDELFLNPFMTVKRAAHILKVSNEAARQAVKVLQENGTLNEISGRAWRRVYVAEPILQIIAPEEMLHSVQHDTSPSV